MGKRVLYILERSIKVWYMIVLLALTILVSACKDENEGYSLEEILSGEAVVVKEEKEEEPQTALPPTVWVHICGEVDIPGIYELPVGSRVYDVLVLAGGFTADADTTHYNLAQVVSDGVKLEIPGRGKENQSAKTVEEPENTLININTATIEQLQTLPGIGKSRAADIVAYREKKGGFESIEQIMEVGGIKEAVFEKIKELITVDL